MSVARRGGKVSACCLTRNDVTCDSNNYNTYCLTPQCQKLNTNRSRSSCCRRAAYPDDEEEHEEDVKDEVDLLTGRVHPANTRFFPVTRSVTTNSGTNVSLQHLAYLDSD